MYILKQIIAFAYKYKLSIFPVASKIMILSPQLSWLLRKEWH